MVRRDVQMPRRDDLRSLLKGAGLMRTNLPTLGTLSPASDALGGAKATAEVWCLGHLSGRGFVGMVEHIQGLGVLCRYRYSFATLPHHSWPFPFVPAAVGFISEDEYLEITGITREQSGEYECSASNDVAAPVVQRVKVTVNCE